ncbi:hypothetical protein NRIC_25230 [Enterococcus florum]|uniref:Transposase n=1 Tax=Enterococcus florum TaxID=2480627 RepID=A0A4P5PG57_9ENTE|nr:hypothetical protein [Enterococcus florum]GCF94632.1 hypothetical protein NRIC_25230 [Enterococcus florum]
MLDQMAKDRDTYEAKLSTAERRGISIGTAKGIGIGSKQKTIELARNMLEKELPHDLISEITGLTLQEIKNLQE